MTDTGFAPLVTTLRQLLAAQSDPGERCEVCRTPITGDHRHVVDIRSRRLLCACAVCAASEGRYRALPARYLHLPSMTISREQWDALGIPVDLVFFFLNSELGRCVACYPGPAGAAESLLPLDAWPALAAAHSWLQTLTPDVEALLVRRAGDRYICYIVPIDACYELVGRIRSTWSGLAGGDAVGRELERFFEQLADKCERGTQAPKPPPCLDPRRGAHA